MSDFGRYRVVRRPAYAGRMGSLRAENRWLLPSALVADPDAARPARRSTRDWIVDTLCFLISLGFAVLVTADLRSADPSLFPGWSQTPGWLVWADLAAGLLASAGLWWRRRRPVPLFIALMVISTFSVTGGPAGMIMLFTVAVHRRFAVTALCAAVSGRTWPGARRSS
jgi:hypothetical protein